MKQWWVTCHFVWLPQFENPSIFWLICCIIYKAIPLWVSVQVVELVLVHWLKSNCDLFRVALIFSPLWVFCGLDSTDAWNLSFLPTLCGFQFGGFQWISQKISRWVYLWSPPSHAEDSKEFFATNVMVSISVFRLGIAAWPFSFHPK